MVRNAWSRNSGTAGSAPLGGDVRGDGVERSEGGRVDAECVGREVRFEVVCVSGAGDEQYVRCVAEQPGEAHLRRGAAERFSGAENGRLVCHLGGAGQGAAEREVGNPGDARLDAQLKHVLVAAGDEAVGILHAGDARRERAAQFVQGHATEPDRADLAFFAQCDHRRELVVEVDDLVVPDGYRGAGAGTAQVDDRDLAEAEAGEVGVDAGGEFFGPLRHAQRVGAARVGVGTGTLYRHFPTREALVEAVYAAELDDVAASASALLGQFPPDVALRGWMDRYATFWVTKHAMLGTLRAGFAPGRISPSTRERVITAIAPILAHGAREGSLRTDIRPEDVATLLLGVFLSTAASDTLEQSGRLLDLVVDALRPQDS
jgi:AcrR family transcriptional regulator